MSALSFLRWVSAVIGGLFLLCYAYQALYVPVALWRKKSKKHEKQPCRRYAVLIAARNEETVIAQLLESIRRQDYPAELVTAFVAADNCTDRTAQRAREAGAEVYERSDRRLVGKGYALQFLLDRIRQRYGDDYFDAYLVFDADNLLRPDYIRQMNDAFRDGRQIVTSYRNTKNYGSSWLSAGYGLWFLRDAAFLNAPRARLGISAVVAGTGFLFSREIMLANNGWPFHSLSEDTEFTVHSILSGEKIGYCGEAEFFDEQPTSFVQSWRQRLRWVRGNVQVLCRYGGPLAAGVFRKNGLSCLDLLLSVPPAIVLTICSVGAGLLASAAELLGGGSLLLLVRAGLGSLAAPCLTLLLVGAITTATQWRRIHTTAARKILYTFTFPLFILSYVPITIAAMFGRVEWTPIEHKISMSIQELK